MSRFVRKAKQKYPIEEAWLFGSWAYGNPGEWSDVDVGIVVADDICEDDESRLFSEAATFDSRLEVHTFLRKRFETERRQIIRDIKQKGIRIA